MEFFEKAFNWLANISARLPKIDFKTYFIVVVAVIVGIGVIIALTYFGSRARKLINASKKIEKYLANVDQIDDDNVSDFTAHCFSSKAPQSLRDSWVQYLGVRFGYPSDIVSDKNVYEKIVKKNKDYRSGIYLAIALIVLGVFAFWGYGTIEAIAMSVVHFVGLVAIGVTYLVLIIINRKQSKRCLEVFDDMQEDLDAKVNLQVESNYATDSSPLAELSGLVEEIIARNTAKAVDEEQEYAVEQTPIEALIEETEDEENEDEESLDEDGEEPQSDEGIEDQEDGAVEQTIDELIASEPQDADEEPAKVAEQADEQTEEQADEEPVQDTDETVEEESVQEETEEVEEVQEPVVDEQESVDEQSAEESEETESEENEEDQEPETEETATEDVEESVEEPLAQEQVESEEPVEQAEEPQGEQESEDAQPDEDETVENDEQSAEEEPQEAEDDQDGESGEDESEQVQSDESGEEEQTDEKGDEKPEVVYVVEGDEEDEENVKPAKLVKLPNLVDYMLTKNMSKPMKIQIASMLIATYNKFKNSKEDRKIVVSCLGKVMSDLQSTK